MRQITAKGVSDRVASGMRKRPQSFLSCLYGSELDHKSRKCLSDKRISSKRRANPKNQVARKLLIFKELFQTL